jgi:hypothetical protein
MHEHLGIAVIGDKLVAELHQVLAQLGAVVDLAIEHDAEALALVPHGLVATL